MYAVSAEFLELAVTSHKAVIACMALDVDGGLSELDVLSGTVTIDGRRDVMRSMMLTLSAEEETYDLLAQPGSEIKLWRGIEVGGIDELVPLGVFVVADVTESQRAAGAINVNGSDRSVRISRNRWRDPYAIASGTNLATAVAALLVDRWAACPIGFSSAEFPQTIAAAIVLDAGAYTDPWKDARGIVSAYGLELYFDGEGIARMRRVPDPASEDPCATYAEGASGVVIEPVRKTSFDRTYSGVVATGEGTSLDAPVRGEAWDTDPRSPTYVEGAFGYVPYFYSSPLITTTAQAQAAAQAQKAQVTGKSNQLTWSQVVNPAHEPLDVVQLIDEAEVSTTHMLDCLTVPLAVAEAMVAIARETRS